MYYFRYKKSERSAVDAWTFATCLCLLAQQLGIELSGRVAEAAYSIEAAVDDEGDTEEEAARRQKWIDYYVSVDEFDEAEELGWDRRTPPDPRETQQVARQSVSVPSQRRDDKRRGSWA